ncbi:MAG: SMP-30/gluconolactonase/LRE family protein [Pseudomonadota bacterium]
MTAPVLSNRRFLGYDLQRPECVLCLRGGEVLCSDRRGGVTIIAADGRLSCLGACGDPRFLTNGFGVKRDGTIVFANAGQAGGIWSIDTDGSVAPVVEEIEGTTNFVLITPEDEIWFSVLTTADHSAPFSAKRADGYIARVRGGTVEIMADGLVSTNEFKIDHARGALYVNETFARRTTRFEMDAAGRLSNRSVLAEYNEGSFPDGLALDANGDIWTPSIIANRITHVTKQGEVSVLYEESDAERVSEVQAALDAEALTRELIYRDTGDILNNPTSLAFGGPNLSTVYVGSISNTYLCAFSSTVPGQPMPHWNR